MKALSLSQKKARALWMKAQGLHARSPFGLGPAATPRAVEQMGYLQIDTISVIERCHHHILFTRIPNYHRQHLHLAQSVEKSLFEYWTHALAYVPTKDFRFFRGDMKHREKNPSRWFDGVQKADLTRLLKRIKKEGALSIRDIADEALVEKDHEWASRKPSKRVLQMGFNNGRLVISERLGMLKKYELVERHFAWEKMPAPASEKETLNYLLDRALRSQAVSSLDSICYLDAPSKAGIRKLIEERVRSGHLVPVEIGGVEKPHWARPEVLDGPSEEATGLVHILSPFDPLMIQRKRSKDFFGFEHRFEAYLPPEKRSYGYFALPVMIGDEVVALIDLKADRQKRKVLIKKWSWLKGWKSKPRLRVIEEELGRFENFQLAKNLDS